MSGPHFGKFRGVVTDNKDPSNMGRVRAKVKDLGDEEFGWATACVPFAGKGAGFFCIPDVNAGVWIEFEHGDPDRPVWSGCWWGSALDPPPEVLVPPYQKVMIKSVGGHSITLDDSPATSGILLRTATGQTIALTDAGILIDNGKGGTITMAGKFVSINTDGLVVS